MAFGQTNTGFQVGIGANPFNTGFNSGFSANSGTNNRNSTTKSNKKSYDDTYNPRYPGFNEEDYKRLERMVDEKGLTGWEKTDTMDQLYQIYRPQVLNRHKLDERQQEINDSVDKNGEALLNGDKEVTMGTDLTRLAQEAKKRYNIPYNVDDNELIKDIVADTENGNKLLYEYTQNGNPEIFYAAGIWDRPQVQSTSGVKQGGIKSLINPASEGGILPESGTEWLNPIGATTETIDNAANKFAEKITITGEGAANNLADRINNMSEEEVARYRKEYEQQLKDKDWRVGRVQGDTLVEQLWNAVKGNISYDYNDEDFMEWLISQKATLGESLIGADDILKGETNPNVIQFFGNIPASAVKTFTATVRGLTNPYDTLKGLYKLAATKEGHQALLQRYGSWDALARAMNTDPVGVADDVLAVAELGTNIAKGGLKFTGKVTGNQSLINMGNNIPTIGSANDALSQQAVGQLYGGLDKLAGMTDNKLVQGANRYVQDVSSISKTIENAKSDFNSIRGKANDWANDIIQNNNRMTKKQQETFKEMSGEDQGKWMNDRNLRTQQDLVDYFLESKNKVDDAMGKIEGQFTSKELTAVLDDSIDFAKKTENKDLGRLQELQAKNADGGLTMSEINEVKRFYEKNNKFNYLKEGTAEKSALATNRDTALREWQQNLAAENGLDNLKQLNKETQAAKFLADNATSWQSGIKGNNPISLTDWIVFAGDGINSNSLAGLVSKKIFTAPRFQDKLVDVLNYIGGHETKGDINPNYEAIDMKNYEKRILAEELAKVKNEKQFNDWLRKAQEMAGPALPEKIDQGGVVAGDRPFITQNGPTAQQLGIGGITEK